MPDSRDLVRQQRAQVEHLIGECDKVIADFMRWRDEVGNELEHRIALAESAVDQRSQLLDRIQRESLWAYDYESADDYYDAKGYSRQRIHQIKLEVAWARLVVNADATLPLPRGNMARILGASNPDASLQAYRKANKEGSITYKGLAELVNASREIDVDDDAALTMWRDRQHLQQIETHYKLLKNAGSRDEARKIVGGE